MKQLLEQHVSRIVGDYGAMQVETPIMYDYDHPQLSKYLNRFPARQYLLKSDEKEYFLRFAACFGQYMIQRDMMTSYRDLPMRLYELTHYSFRREQSGELAGLRRLRGFTMPDMHTLVRDLDMAKAEFLEQVKLCLRYLRDVDLPCVPAIRLVKSFHQENPGFAEEVIATVGRPAIVELWDQRFFYFVAKFEMNFVDGQDKAACLSTAQIDVENAERFDIDYVEEDGAKRHPLLMHTSVSGSVDRVIYAILEQQAMRMARGEKAILPLWLSPVQARILPVSGTYTGAAMALAEKLPFRVDVDDRDLKVGRKIRDAEKEWVPYLLVYGEREHEGGDLAVRPRIGDQIAMSLDAFVLKLREETHGRPFQPLNTPRRLSVRPVFTG
jgi:threonyl-tRNA synthetase